MDPSPCVPSDTDATPTPLLQPGTTNPLGEGADVGSTAARHPKKPPRARKQAPPATGTRPRKGVRQPQAPAVDAESDADAPVAPAADTDEAPVAPAADTDKTPVAPAANDADAPAANPARDADEAPAAGAASKSKSKKRTRGAQALAGTPRRTQTPRTGRATPSARYSGGDIRSVSRTLLAAAAPSPGHAAAARVSASTPPTPTPTHTHTMPAVEEKHSSRGRGGSRVRGGGRGGGRRGGRGGARQGGRGGVDGASDDDTSMLGGGGVAQGGGNGDDDGSDGDDDKLEAAAENADPATREFKQRRLEQIAVWVARLEAAADAEAPAAGRGGSSGGRGRGGKRRRSLCAVAAAKRLSLRDTADTIQDEYDRLQEELGEVGSEDEGVVVDDDAVEDELMETEAQEKARMLRDLDAWVASGVLKKAPGPRASLETVARAHDKAAAKLGVVDESAAVCAEAAAFIEQQEALAARRQEHARMLADLQKWWRSGALRKPLRAVTALSTHENVLAAYEAACEELQVDVNGGKPVRDDAEAPAASAASDAAAGVPAAAAAAPAATVIGGRTLRNRSTIKPPAETYIAMVMEEEAAEAARDAKKALLKDLRRWVKEGLYVDGADATALKALARPTTGLAVVQAEHDRVRLALGIVTPEELADEKAAAAAAAAEEDGTDDSSGGDDAGDGSSDDDEGYDDESDGEGGPHDAKAAAAGNESDEDEDEEDDAEDEAASSSESESDDDTSDSSSASSVASKAAADKTDAATTAWGGDADGADPHPHPASDVDM